jgi:hypothetical protein
MKVRTGSRGIALPFLNLGTRWGWVVNATPRPLYHRERDPVRLRVVWTSAENLVPTGIRSPARPARSESLYRQRYPDPLIKAAYHSLRKRVNRSSHMRVRWLHDICLLLRISRILP